MTKKLSSLYTRKHTLIYTLQQKPNKNNEKKKSSSSSDEMLSLLLVEDEGEGGGIDLGYGRRVVFSLKQV